MQAKGIILVERFFQIARRLGYRQQRQPCVSISIRALLASGIGEELQPDAITFIQQAWIGNHLPGAIIEHQARSNLAFGKRQQTALLKLICRISGAGLDLSCKFRLQRSKITSLTEQLAVAVDPCPQGSGLGVSSCSAVDGALSAGGLGLRTKVSLL